MKIVISTYDNEYFVAKEEHYHQTIPTQIQISLHHPVITLDPICIA